jgi:predicted enzyme related to lactoylglutathione lyase
MATTKFVWHELMTGDIPKAVEFYTKLIGWTVKETEVQGWGKYTMLCAGDKDVAGVLPIDPKKPVPPNWLCYVGVESADKTIERAKALKGRVEFGPMDIPTVGRIAVTADPLGAVFAVFQPQGTGMAPPADEKPKPGEFCWDETMTSDPKAAVAFYGELFNWAFSDMDMGPMGTYHLAKSGGNEVAGVMKLPPDVKTPPHWMTYIFVADLDKTSAEVKKLGGNVLMGPMPIPNIGRFTVIQDPTGAVVSLFGEPK